VEIAAVDRTGSAMGCQDSPIPEYEKILAERIGTYIHFKPFAGIVQYSSEDFVISITLGHFEDLEQKRFVI
jgi:hypothetical protein